eukprot:PhM_4_TR2059/c0_g1_i6/m.43184
MCPYRPTTQRHTITRCLANDFSRVPVSPLVAFMPYEHGSCLSYFSEIDQKEYEKDDDDDDDDDDPARPIELSFVTNFVTILEAFIMRRIEGEEDQRVLDAVMGVYPTMPGCGCQRTHGARSSPWATV